LIQEADIVAFLTQVGTDLEEFGFQEPVRLLLIGGAFMITQLRSRTATGDIDVALLEWERWGEIYELFKRIVLYELSEIGASAEGFSDDITEFLPLMGLPKIRTLWLSVGKLEVYVPDPGYILALKLLANRDKDQPDLQVLLALLKIKRRKQAEKLLKTYVSEDIRVEYAEKLERVLSAHFPR
jgi:hypothetical protein